MLNAPELQSRLALHAFSQDRPKDVDLTEGAAERSSSAETERPRNLQQQVVGAVGNSVRQLLGK